MGVVSAIVQFLGPGGQQAPESEAYVGVAYVLFDDSVPVTEEVSMNVVPGLTFANRGSWKDIIVQAIIDDAATRGRVLGAANIQWPCFEPGNSKLTNHAASWHKDRTFANIGTSFVNVYIGANGEAQIVDCARYKECRIVVFGNKVGTGTLSHQLAEVGTANVLTGPDYAGAAGEFSADSGWTALPAWAVGEKIIRPQAKSTVSTDDPVYRQVLLYLR